MRLNQACVEFLEGYFSTHERRKKTQTAYQLDLSQFEAFAGNHINLLEVNGTLIEQWAAHLRQEKYSSASIRRKMVTLRVFSSYWVRKGILPESPFWRVKLSFGRVEQLPRSLTEREMRALLRRAWRNYSAFRPNLVVAKESKTNQEKASRGYRTLRNLAIVDLLFATGMRVGEVSALDMHDFFIKEAVLRVQGKGGRDRLAFIVDSTSAKIQRIHIDARSRLQTESRALFVNAAGGRLSTQGITKIIAKLRREARIARHITPHMLRHTVATLLLRNGADIRIVQEFLGHTSIVTTQRYTHITKDHMIRVLRRRHPSIKLNPDLPADLKA
jgi:integrase/recombinase XerD